ncbi:DUF1287 domain-containing protein [bacterium]|nr:DUF1287 domain-containing protein [bacterium]
MHRRSLLTALGFLLASGAGRIAFGQTPDQAPDRSTDRARDPTPEGDAALPTAARIAAGALAQIGVMTLYDPSYVRLDYPMGDVPIERGVCSDVVVRALRAAGIDLQAEIHQDMARHFAAYPDRWGLTRPDRNIDHRRVPNIETLFKRKGLARRASANATDYLPGDIVSWRLSGSGLPHIGVVAGFADIHTALVVHNIGAGARLEPVLFDWPIETWARFE